MSHETLPSSHRAALDQAETRPQVTTPIIVGYSVGSLGTGIYSTVPSVLLLFFMTDTLGVSPALAALAFFFPKIWDVITDPVMGVISDRTKSRMGRRRPYLLLGAILMSLTFVGLFNVPEMESPVSSFLYVLVVFTLSATAYTVFAVPYIAMPAEMSADHHERTVIMSFRMAFAMAGILIGSSLAPFIVEWAGGGRSGYSQMSFLIGGICAITMLIAFFATRNTPDSQVEDASPSAIFESFALLRHNQPFRALVLVYVLQLAAMGVFMAAIPYFAVYIMGGDVSLVGAIFLVMLSAAIVTMIVWTYMARWFGKKISFASAAVIYGIGAFGLLFIHSDVQSSRLYIQIAVIGFGLAGMQMLPFSMLTDAVRLDRLTTGKRREGAYTGFWTASEKLGLAVGPLIAGNFLAFAGFQESVDGAAQIQADSALMAIRILVAVVPAVIIILSACLIRNYPITEELLEASEQNRRFG